MSFKKLFDSCETDQEKLKLVSKVWVKFCDLKSIEEVVKAVFKEIPRYFYEMPSGMHKKWMIRLLRKYFKIRCNS